MAFAGLASLFGVGGMSANMAKLPGVLLALTGSVGFAVGIICLVGQHDGVRPELVE